MLARSKKSKSGKVIPLDWSEGLARLLNETYKRECKDQNRYFDVYGQIYSEELLVVCSWLSEKDEHLAPIAEAKALGLESRQVRVVSEHVPGVRSAAIGVFVAFERVERFGQGRVGLGRRAEEPAFEQHQSPPRT